jgi:hypothetical protein
MSDWFDNNWIDLARLLVQCGILAGVVGYSRKLLKTLRASQEQIGALLRLSVSDGSAPDRAASIADPAPAPPGFAAPSFAAREPLTSRATPPANGFASSASMPAYVPEREHSLSGRMAAESVAVQEPEPMQANAPTLTPWIAAPSHGDPERAEGLAERMADSRRNLGHWLKEPPRRSFNPFRSVFRWLQAPAGSRARS